MVLPIWRSEWVIGMDLRGLVQRAMVGADMADAMPL